MNQYIDQATKNMERVTDSMEWLYDELSVAIEALGGDVETHYLAILAEHALAEAWAASVMVSLAKAGAE
jgi:hypothetical protein